MKRLGILIVLALAAPHQPPHAGGERGHRHDHVQRDGEADRQRQGSADAVDDSEGFPEGEGLNRSVGRPRGDGPPQTSGVRQALPLGT